MGRRHGQRERGASVALLTRPGLPATPRISADLLGRAKEADRRKDFAAAAQLAGEAAVADPQNLNAWRMAGVFRERLGDYRGALEAYDRALSLSPDNANLTRDLARLAGFLDLPQLAEQFLLRAQRLDPSSVEIANDLAVAYCAQSRFSEAIDLLRDRLTAEPGAAMLWNTLGCVLFESGEAAQSLVFFDEALRLEPDLHTAYFNRANARKALGDIPAALEDCERALALGADSASQAAMYRYARALLLLNAGEIGAGWDAYAVRNDPAYADHVHHELVGRAWTPGEPLLGRRLLVMGEQGLGDEVLFANVLRDVAGEIGSNGELLIAVEPRLVALFQRSFPAARVFAYQTRYEGPRRVRHIPALAPSAYDTWARMGDLLANYRRSLAAFPKDPAGFLKADPQRVEHWRSVLSGLGPQPKVGVIWRSLVITSQRQKFYPPLAHWGPLFDAPGITFVNLQIGDCAEELADIVRATGADIRTLPAIDLRADLDELAALSCALDLVVGPATATTNIAAAVGAPTWFATTPDAWPRLGTAAFPWHPGARAFSGEDGYHWPTVMTSIGEAVRAQFPIRP